jgi:hypothetical protein
MNPTHLNDMRGMTAEQRAEARRVRDADRAARDAEARAYAAQHPPVSEAQKAGLPRVIG